jgi:hypothetical protein
VRIKALGKSPGRGDKPIVNVKLLGSYESLNWSQEADALVIQRLRRIPSLHAVAFKINFKE